MLSFYSALPRCCSRSPVCSRSPAAAAASRRLVLGALLLSVLQHWTLHIIKSLPLRSPYSLLYLFLKCQTRKFRKVRTRYFLVCPRFIQLLVDAGFILLLVRHRLQRSASRSQHCCKFGQEQFLVQTRDTRCSAAVAYDRSRHPVWIATHNFQCKAFSDIRRERNSSTLRRKSTTINCFCNDCGCSNLQSLLLFLVAIIRTFACIVPVSCFEPMLFQT